MTVWGQDPIGLRASSSIRQLNFGAAASIKNLKMNIDSGQFNSYIKKNYHLIVPENDLKPQKLWRSENNYNWKDSDWLLGATPESTGWAQTNSMQIRGHTLVWATDKRIPKWLLQQESSITSNKAKLLLSNYIHAVVGRYRGKISSWDVINEAIEDGQNNERPFNMRNCFWYRKLGRDFVKHAFIFAHQADPETQLYYNDYGIERIGLKANRTLELITWVKSQGATIHGVGMQWHVGLWARIRLGDQYYTNAQRFIDNGFDFIVSELDVAIPVKGDNPQDPKDLERQGLVYRSLVKYALHFSPRCRGFITWGFTDRYSWIPAFSDYRKGFALPTDRNYQPKLAYLEMQEELSRVMPDGTYRLIPQSQSGKCLDTYDKGDTGGIRIYNEGPNQSNQKWNLTWLIDGTYRLTPISAMSRALDAYNEKTVKGGVQAYRWWGGNNQRWVLSPTGFNAFRIAPRTVWWRALTVHGTSSIVIEDYADSADQHWIFTRI